MNIYLEYKTFIFYQLEMNHGIFIRQKMWDQTLQKWIKFCDKIRICEFFALKKLKFNFLKNFPGFDFKSFLCVFLYVSMNFSH